MHYLEILNWSKIKWLMENLRLFLSERFKCISAEGDLCEGGSGGMANGPRGTRVMAYFLI